MSTTDAQDRLLSVEVASGDALDVREFHVEERMSAPYEVRLVVLSDSPGLDFDAIVGQPARFTLRSTWGERSWTGLVRQMEQVGVDEEGLSTYEISLVHELWLLGQRRNHRMFQQVSEPDIVLALLAEWNIAPEVRIDRPEYRTRKYRVQYAETDHAFASRMLEDAGISYFLVEEGPSTRLVLSDAPHAGEPRGGGPLRFVERPLPGAAPVEYITSVRIGQRMRPSKYTIRDHDPRLAPAYPLVASAEGGLGAEEGLERYHYVPGAFLFGTERGEPTPVADDRGKTRSDEATGKKLAAKRLDAKRGSGKVVSFATNAHDLRPGTVMEVDGHPHPMLGPGKRLLVVASVLRGTSHGEWSHTCEARAAEVPYRPPLTTPKPRVGGMESATVVGPAGEEIHTDEFGRVRVHFHWDRESRMDERSSCWIPVSQPWGGAGYGGINLPRVGQEVLVGFVRGDPDRPVVVGRVFTALQKVPYSLPENRTRSGWKSNSTGGTGGYNEIMFEDAAGKELFRVQAEKDLQRLVKNDETSTIGRDRSTTVGGSESKTVAMSQRVSVGVNRATQVGRIDSTVVGEMHSLTVMPPGEGDLEQYFAVTHTAGAVSLSLRGGGPTFTMTRSSERGVGTPAEVRLDNGQGASIALTDDTVYIHANRIVLYTTRTVPAGVGAGSIALQGAPLVLLNPDTE